MKAIRLHIISFNVPYPPNYGGVIDVFYKIKALKQLGVKVVLHCYSYGREGNEQLESLTEKTYYYKRDTSFRKHLSTLPFIINSRDNKDLLSRLLKDNFPILFEGLHTCYHIANKELQGRVKIVRAHNIEHDYYNGLAYQEKNLVKRLYFFVEAAKLKMFEAKLKDSTYIAAISVKDQNYFQKKFNNAILLPPFHSNEKVLVDKTKGKYALYHGSLDVVENIEAVLFLINTFKDEPEIPLVIAGRKADLSILKALEGIGHIRLVSDSSNEEMKELISKAQINILPTFQATGVKLKLLEALYSGKHLLCNNAMVSGTNLASVCHIAESKEDFVKSAKKLMETRIEDGDISHRKQLLDEWFNNKVNAQSIVNLIV